MIRKRAIYRKADETVYRIKPDGNYIAVSASGLFGTEIKRAKMQSVPEEYKIIKKKEFINQYRKARKLIRL
jgi:hypothetical protein